MENQATKQAASSKKREELIKKADFFQHFFAHFDVAKLCGVRELEFLPEPVDYAGIEIGPLIQQVEKLRSRGRVLVVGPETAGVLNGDCHGQGAKVAGLLVRKTGSNVHSHDGNDIGMRFFARKYYLKGAGIPGWGMNPFRHWSARKGTAGRFAGTVALRFGDR
jgi:hypothetical protein